MNFHLTREIGASTIDIDDISLASIATLEDALVSCSRVGHWQFLSWFKGHSLSTIILQGLNFMRVRSTHYVFIFAKFYLYSWLV